MRFLADENFPGSAVLALRTAGHEVEWIREIAPGATDDQVLGKALRMGAIILTFDRDFGMLARRMKHAAEYGVLVF